MNESENQHPQKQKLAKLEELCQLLLRKNGPVADWFSTLSESHTDVDPFTTVGFLSMDEKALITSGFLPQLFMVLHECILNLRWSEVLRVLRLFIHFPKGSSHTVWKVGNELLQKEGNERLVRQLFNQMKSHSELVGKDVILEYAFYLLSCGDSQAALSTIQEVVHRKGLKKDKTAKDCYVDKLTRAYTGLLWYVEWKKLQQRLNETEAAEHNDLMSQMSSQAQTLEMRMNNCADKAILCFDELVGQPGVWDIFVTKHVELLVAKQKKNRALIVLQKSVELSPENPNTQKYLYRFCLEHFPDSNIVMNQLKVVVNLVPSDFLVLELCEKLHSEDLGQACGYLFKLLDYPCWQDVLAPWKMMGEYLAEVFKNKLVDQSAMTVVQECWSPRSSWWPLYHFTDFWLAQNHEEGLVYSKALVAGLLVGSDNNFSKKAKKLLSSSERKKLRRTLKKS